MVAPGPRMPLTIACASGCHDPPMQPCSFGDAGQGAQLKTEHRAPAGHLLGPLQTPASGVPAPRGLRAASGAARRACARRPCNGVCCFSGPGGSAGHCASAPHGAPRHRLRSTLADHAAASIATLLWLERHAQNARGRAAPIAAPQGARHAGRRRGPVCSQGGCQRRRPQAPRACRPDGQCRQLAEDADSHSACGPRGGARSSGQQAGSRDAKQVGNHRFSSDPPGNARWVFPCV